MWKTKPQLIVQKDILALLT